MIIDAISNHKDLFTSIYEKVREATTRFVIVYGGSSSSKSYSVHQDEVLNLLEPTTGNTLFIRKYASDLKDSCYTLCENIATSFEIYHLFSWAYSNNIREIRNKRTKKKILFRGIDDPEKIKSIAGIKRIVIEEASQLQKKDFLEINRRIRGIEDLQIILIFNPIDERHWIKEYFFDTPSRRKKTTIIHATYKDNKQNLTKDDIEELELAQEYDPNGYRIYTLGKWGKPNVQRPYVHNFEYNKHASERAVFQEFIPVLFSIDFNLEPLVCTASHMWTDEEGAHWHTFKEFVLKLGSVPAMCDLIEDSFPDHVLSNMKWTGDATGRKRDITTRENFDAWTIIDQRFHLKRRLMVPKSNPSVRENRHLMNAIYALHPDRAIHPDCKLLLDELQFTEADPEGNILKKNRDKLEQRADALDCDRYKANTWLWDFIKKSNKYRKLAA